MYVALEGTIAMSMLRESFWTETRQNPRKYQVEEWIKQQTKEEYLAEKESRVIMLFLKQTTDYGQKLERETVR